MDVTNHILINVDASIPDITKTCASKTYQELTVHMQATEEQSKLIIVI